jgi:hypothetical protein
MTPPSTPGMSVSPFSRTVFDDVPFFMAGVYEQDYGVSRKLNETFAQLPIKFCKDFQQKSYLTD